MNDYLKTIVRFVQVVFILGLFFAIIITILPLISNFEYGIDKQNLLYGIEAIGISLTGLALTNIVSSILLFKRRRQRPKRYK